MRVIAGVVAFIVLLFLFIEHQIRSSVVYQTAIAQAALSGDVAVALGTPIRGGWLNTGEITESSDGRGAARLKIALSGPKGKGTLTVAATRSGEVWHIRILEFVSRETSKRVDVLRGKTASVGN